MKTERNKIQDKYNAIILKKLSKGERVMITRDNSDFGDVALTDGFSWVYYYSKEQIFKEDAHVLKECSINISEQFIKAKPMLYLFDKKLAKGTTVSVFNLKDTGSKIAIDVNYTNKLFKGCYWYGISRTGLCYALTTDGIVVGGAMPVRYTED